MFPFNFRSNQSISIPNQNSISSLNSISSNCFGPTTNMELYPRRRRTEFYYEPQPMEEFQSRVSEHPQDKLAKAQSSRFSLNDIHEEFAPRRINPPRNSDMRMLRDSYFS